MSYQGIGGAFLYAVNPDELAAWYRDVLGAPLAKQGSMWWVELPGRDVEPQGRGATTTFAIMKADEPLPELARARLNHRVADLNAIIGRLEQLGVPFEGPEEEYGRFLWCRDPEGHRVEVWEPSPREPTAGPVEIVGPDARLATLDVGAHDLVLETVIPMPVHPVWKLWSTSEGLSSWLCPSANVELRLGGPYEIHFLPDAPRGQRGSDGCKVLSFVTGRMLSFTWNAPPSIPETRDARTFVVVEFEPLGDETRVRLTHSGWPVDLEAGRWNDTHAYFASAWRSVMSALEDHARR